MNSTVIITIIGVLLLFPIQYSFAAPLDDILEKRIVPIEQVCGKKNMLFEFTCDWKCGNEKIDYMIINNEREILSSGSFEQDLRISYDSFPNGKYIEFSKKGFQNNELIVCEDQFSNTPIIDRDFTAPKFESYNYEETKTETKTNVDKVYTYAEIYSITDQAGLDCDNKHGPSFGSMNQQSAWNNCHNNVNTWELNQLDRTDYYGEPQRESSGGGCLIATATYGSEMAPQVQQLRELRDNQLLQTESGTAFMGTFNDVYYSFSPIIADYERENPLFKETVKIAITPMISSLSLMENANSESEVLGLGLSVIALNIGMYLGVPSVVIVGIRKIK